MAPPTEVTYTRGENGAAYHTDFGKYTRRVTTDSGAAQRWFDQGIQLTYGFNHDAAIRAYKESAAADPDCAMAYWGIAYCNGININDWEMNDPRNREAYMASRAALTRAEDVSGAERAMIEAMAARYAWPAPKNRKKLDEAYAEMMQIAHERYPGDPDIGVVYADAMMNLQAWDYWTHDGEPVGRIDEIVQALEGVMRNNPEHPGAHHFYIHAVEASDDPDRAVRSADKLAALVPGSGHLVHMPSHIYIRVGRYSDAAESNTYAAALDKAYFTSQPQASYYRLYYAHNLHFLAYASMMEGRYSDAMRAARALETEVPEEFVRAHTGTADGLLATVYHVMIRFGKWHDVLEEPEPADYRLVSRAVRLYARGVALSALGRTDEAREEIDQFELAINKVPKDWMIFNNKLHDVLPIARGMVYGELAYREGRYDEAFDYLRGAIEAEDSLVYDEPPGWMLPVRHALGALLMGAKRHEEAEYVYRENLEQNRLNGWALLGLQQSLIAQGRVREANTIAPMLSAAWPNPDVRPTSSCYCEPGM
jgi:tetratricopeptide (TPR) repeat protein